MDEDLEWKLTQEKEQLPAEKHLEPVAVAA